MNSLPSRPVNRHSPILPALACALAAALPMTPHAAEFAPIFNDGAVLQHGVACRIWGTGVSGETVVILLDGREMASATVGAGGAWSAELPPQPPGGEHAMEVRADSGSSRVGGVAYGEVWIASGQSNMVMPLMKTFGGEEWLGQSIPEIRFVVVPRQSGLPAKPHSREDLAWSRFAPPDNARIAAVAFHFAREIQQATGHVVGILQSSVGGTPAQAWTPMDTLESHPELDHYAKALKSALAENRAESEWREEYVAYRKSIQAFRKWRGNKEGERPELSPLSPGNPFNTGTGSILYENMIRPIQPYTARGVVWYQGEGNAGAPQEYRILFPAMIKAWRKAWGRPDWPFYFVQLAAYNHDSTDWSELRAAQAYTRDTVPHTGMAVAIDVGEKEDIHPRDKQPVGLRLARLALNQVYGKKTATRGPFPDSARLIEEGVEIRFQHTEGGLESRDDASLITGFEVSTGDGEYKPTRGRITSSDTVVLMVGGNPAVQSVRYGWASWPDPPVNLQNSEDLPAEPFLMKVPAP